MTVLTSQQLAALNAGNALSLSYSGTLNIQGPAPTAAPAPAPLAVSVKGNKLVDQTGKVIRFKGVNISALEAVPIAGWSPSDPWGGRFSSTTLAALRSWTGLNAVRIPLNEASVLGLTCYDLPIAPATVGVARQADPGNNVISTLKTTVASLTAAGLYVILDLHINSPNAAVPGIAGVVPTTPNCQNQMADADHSITFWTTIANNFKMSPNVVFELFNEPHIDNFVGSTGYIDPAGWKILRDGGTATAFMAGKGPGTNLLNEMVNQNWNSVGTQAMVNAIRATGAKNVILSPGLSYNQYMQGWATYAPVDPLKQLAASWHPYASKTDNTQPGFPTSFADVQAILAAGYPVVPTETGDFTAAGAATWLPILLPWLDANGLGGIAWTWDVWGQNQFNLIVDSNGTPTGGEGVLWKGWCAT